MGFGDPLCCNVKFALRELIQLLNEVFDCVFIFEAKWYLFIKEEIRYDDWVS